MTEPLQALLHAWHRLPPDEMAAVVAVHAHGLGARETVPYLADYQQASLLPLTGAGVPARQEVPIEGTMAERAFRRVQQVDSTAVDGRHHLWWPLLDGVERARGRRTGLRRRTAADGRRLVGAFPTLVGELLVVKDAYYDVFARLRRRKTLTPAAEIQWELLPPLTFSTDRW